jgi:CheY-like chemotaxis protein
VKLTKEPHFISISMIKINKAYIIDDDEIFLTLVEIHMEKSGLFGEILAFENGEDAIEQLLGFLENTAELPDFILLDLNMPIMDGWQFLDAYMNLNINKEIPIFIATSSIDPRDLEKSKSYAVVEDYVLKPVTGQKIQDMVAKLNL